MQGIFQIKENIVEIRTKNFHIIWGLLATLGTFIASLILFIQGIKFESSYSLIYIATSFIGMPFGLITFLWGAPGFFSKRKTILIINKGKTLASAVKNKRTVNISDIKEIRMDRHFFSLSGIIYEDIIIITRSGKRKRIPSYNLVGPVVFDRFVRDYILPYMDEKDREVWLQNNKGFYFAESSNNVSK
ncbi:DUF5381 family protein [Metabacillus sp. KIGAM252]|uniref:DUF5381 family protein n=1 Tax=Metabacillus flavus TaxID=2823519 RepID=A0ABS5LIS6_9BACI|nr:DUF5381 family protein [Metabacillus flavus]MBS2970637.1 DUF5381 family protein [Metabacillus flavus]